MYKQAKRGNKGKSTDKLNRILDVVGDKLLNDDVAVKKAEDEPKLDVEIEKALDSLGEDSDCIVMEDDSPKKKIRIGEEKKSEEPAMTTNNLPPVVGHGPNGAGSFMDNGNSKSKRNIHQFIDALTSDKTIPNEVKQTITLAFYDYEVSNDVIPYFDSLFATRKSFDKIASSLLWFINCLKTKNNK